MYSQVFESALLPYQLPSERSGIPGFVYHTELLVPPRIYSETIASIDGLFVSREKTATSDFVIHVLTTMSQIYYPSYRWLDFAFDGATGAFIDRVEVLYGDLYQRTVHPARDGSLWRVSVLGSFAEIDPSTFEEVPGSTESAAKYGATTLDLPLVDRSQNLVIMKTNNDVNAVGCYDFTTGALIRRINISGAAAAIFAEDARRAYVLTTQGMLNLIDYSTGEILSTTKAPQAESGALGSLLTWDRFLRRLLLFTWRADDTDGASLSSISGYYPIPQPVGITKAIPLIPPRVGRTVPMLSRAYGDAGEAIPGVKMVADVTGATATLAPPSTDQDGHALINVACAAAGSATIDLESEV